MSGVAGETDQKRGMGTLVLLSVMMFLQFWLNPVPENSCVQGLPARHGQNHIKPILICHSAKSIAVQ